ncbi:MAG: TetR/AcrR family transcriptional regulator [Luteolibacter sp.]
MNTDSPAQPKPTKTRARLLEAARAEFSEKGLECATTRSIAERAGCNEVTLFRHFENKQKLLSAVVQETSEEFRNFCCCSGKMSGDPFEDLLLFGKAYNGSLAQCEGMVRMLIGESSRKPTLCKELIGDVLLPFHRSISNYLEDRILAGAVRSGLNTLAFAEIFTSSLMGSFLRRASGLSILDTETGYLPVIEFLVHGIIAAPSES